MEISVLLYVSESDPDAWILEALRSAGITVKTAKNLSRLHYMLASRFFTAVVIRRNALANHGVSPSRHLWESQIPVTIIAYGISEEKTLNTTVFSVPKHSTGFQSGQSDIERVNTVNSVLLSLKASVAPSRPPDHTVTGEEKLPERGPQIAFEETFLGTLHKKMRSILETLASAGPEGIEAEKISLSVWENTARDRKKDIQIYISRLRKITGRYFSGRYRIELVKNRYILSDSRSS